MFNPKQYKKEYYLKKRENLLNYAREYYQKNKEIIKKRTAEWARKNPEKCREYSRLKSRRYRRQFPEKYREKYKKCRETTRARCAEWRRTNPEKHCATQARRRAMQRTATIGDLTDIYKIYERAKWWKQWFDVVVDHIVPLSKGGSHEANNLQIIYAFENSAKHDRLNYHPSVIFGEN